MRANVAPYGVKQITEKDVAESLAVLATLEARIREQPLDYEAWHRRGMIAWALRERDRAKPPIKSIDWTMLGRMADTSLRIAAQLKKASEAYQRDVSLFLLSSGAVYTPLVTQGRVNRIERKGLDEDRNAESPALRAAGIIRVARTYWRAWEHGHDALRISGKWPVTGMLDAGAVFRVREMVANASSPDPRDTSEADYRQAESLFREAYNEAPDYGIAFPQLAWCLSQKTDGPSCRRSPTTICNTTTSIRGRGSHSDWHRSGSVIHRKQRLRSNMRFATWMRKRDCISIAFSA